MANFKMRIPTDEEYDRLVEVTGGDNDKMHWDHMASWVNDERSVDNKYQTGRGYRSARLWRRTSASSRILTLGFRPAFDALHSDALALDLKDGDSVIIGTLYMDGKPVKVPQDPTWKGDITIYIPGAILEIQEALDDPAYQVRAIKTGNVLVCDRCLLKWISYTDIADAVKEEQSESQKHHTAPATVFELMQNMNRKELAQFLSKTFCLGFGEVELENWLQSKP